MKATSSNIIHSSLLTKADTYAKVTQNKHEKAKKYLGSINLFNKLTGEIKPIEYNREWHENQSYLFKTFVMDDIRYQANTMGLVPIFITITLPSEYHPYNYNPKSNVKHLNKRYQGHSIEEGYKRLIGAFRALTNGFKVDRKTVKRIKYIRVVEPHKSMVAHLHAIVWVDSDNLNAFKHHYHNVISRFDFNYKGQDFKELNSEETKGTTVYLLKYVEKTLKGGDDVISGWLTMNNIKRVMTNSKASLSRVIFKRISHMIPFNPNDKRSYLLQIKESLIINSSLVDCKGSILRDKQFIGVNPLYVVNMTVERDMIIDDVIVMNDIDADKFIYKHTYKVIDMVITSILDGNKVYNKRDVVLFGGVESNLLYDEIRDNDNESIELIYDGNVEEVHYL